MLAKAASAAAPTGKAPQPVSGPAVGRMTRYGQPEGRKPRRENRADRRLGRVKCCRELVTVRQGLADCLASGPGAPARAWLMSCRSAGGRAEAEPEPGSAWFSLRAFARCGRWA